MEEPTFGSPLAPTTPSYKLNPLYWEKVPEIPAVLDS